MGFVLVQAFPEGVEVFITRKEDYIWNRMFQDNGQVSKHLWPYSVPIVGIFFLIVNYSFLYESQPEC